MIHKRKNAALSTAGRSGQVVTGAFVMVAMMGIGCLGMLFMQQFVSVSKSASSQKIGMQKRNRSLQEIDFDEMDDDMEQADSLIDDEEEATNSRQVGS
jgi:hypothetical protein